LQTEEQETLTDPDSKIIWRNEQPTRLNGTTRLFKTRFENPYPKKKVATIDFVSTGTMASYDLVAGTVANHDDRRVITPAAISSEPERHFDGACAVRAVDADSGLPIAGVLVDPGMSVDKGIGVIAVPSRTDADGSAVVYYPKGRVNNYYIDLEIQGYEAANAAKDGELPDMLTFKLRRLPQDQTSSGPQ
jgi:hypothetical protein